MRFFSCGDHIGAIGWYVFCVHGQVKLNSNLAYRLHPEAFPIRQYWSKGTFASIQQALKDWYTFQRWITYCDDKSSMLTNDMEENVLYIICMEILPQRNKSTLFTHIEYRSSTLKISQYTDLSMVSSTMQSPQFHFFVLFMDQAKFDRG